MGLFNRKKTIVEDAPVKEKTRILVFYGLEQGLLPYHVALLLKSAEKGADILLIDNSRTQTLFESVPGQDGIGTVRDMYVLSNRAYTEEKVHCYNYVIVFMGENEDETYFSKATDLFVCSDYQPFLIKKMMSAPIIHGGEENSRLTSIFLDKVSNKIQEKDILKQLPYINKGDLCLTADISPEDHAAYLAFLYNGVQKLSVMSSDWKSIILEVCSLVNDEKSSTYKKMLKSI